MRRSSVLAAGAALPLLLTGCGASDAASDADGTVRVVVGFYPLQYLAERIGGDAVSVVSLAQPGAEPHDLELSPQQVQQVAEADLTLYLRTFQPAVDAAVEQNAADRAFDVLGATSVVEGYEELGHNEEHADEEHADEGEHSDEEEHADEADEHGGIDPHVWLDPTKYAELATAVGDRLADSDPDHAATYQDNARTLVDELTTLDDEFSTGLGDCERSEIVTTHNAFGYLAAHYGLQQVGIAGISPDAEPSPQDLQEVADYAREHDVTTIFYEEAVTPEYADTVAAEVGAETAVLSPLEVVDDGGDYFSVMRDNLATLRTALGCR